METKNALDRIASSLNKQANNQIKWLVRDQVAGELGVIVLLCKKIVWQVGMQVDEIVKVEIR